MKVRAAGPTAPDFCVRPVRVSVAPCNNPELNNTDGRLYAQNVTGIV